jgi:uncharacterized protein with von Willebrand factor type A (vWA) domain
MADEQRRAEPEHENPERQGQQKPDDVEDLEVDPADAEQVKGRGWPYTTAGGRTSGGLLGG